MSFWKILSFSLLVALVFVLLAENLLVVPRLFAPDNIRIGDLEIEMVSDWYCTQRDDRTAQITSVEKEDIIMTLRFKRELTQVDIDELESTFLPKTKGCCETYRLEDFEVLELHESDKVRCHAVDIILVPELGLQIYYIGDLARKYAVLTRVLNSTKKIKGNG